MNKKNKELNKYFKSQFFNIIGYIIYSLICLYILKFKLYINEFNYINSEIFKKNKTSLVEYILKRLTCGKYCLWIPVIQKDSFYYKIDLNLSYSIFYLFIIFPIILPMLYINFYGITNSKKKKKKKFRIYIYNQIFRLILFIILLFTIFV